MMEKRTACRLCPRACMADRESGERGRCGVSADIRVARAALHMWEEPCISGERGSGTVFFSGCPLGCVFCQNRAISTGQAGKDISEERLAEIFMELQAEGANNINLVTAGHFLGHLIRAIKLSKNMGLKIPIVYNTGSYETVDAIRALDGLVDVYLPDIKFYYKETAVRYAGAADYFDTALAAVREMHRQCPKPVFCLEKDASGKSFDTEKAQELWEEGQSCIMTRGLIIRHLLLPGHLADAKNIVYDVLKEFGDSVFLSLMNQYTPMPGLPYRELLQRVKAEEYEELLDYALEIGLSNGFFQDGETAKESFIPQFDLKGV